MILINLLPHREEARKRRKQAFFVGLGASVAVGALIVGGWFTVLERMTSSQQDRNAYLRAENQKLDTQIKDIAELKAEIESLKSRQKAVEDLQTDRNIPVYLLNELVKQTPEGVYLTAIKQADQTITVTGIAQTNERVSEFLRNTLYNSPWLEKPELVEIKMANVKEASRDQRRLYDFSMRLNIKRPGPASAVTAAASAPVAPKKS